MAPENRYTYEIFVENNLTFEWGDKIFLPAIGFMNSYNCCKYYILIVLIILFLFISLLLMLMIILPSLVSIAMIAIQIESMIIVESLLFIYFSVLICYANFIENIVIFIV